jgi:predicted AlkP superfamily pyrophosphatase or phosphodiesterase
MPASYTEPDAHGLKIPTLRQLAASGAFSPGVRAVMPAVTYPSHTSMVTGVSPARHGIFSNVAFDPEGKRDGEWFWYTAEIRVPTLWSLAHERGLRTALIGWPVTLGARADALTPEFWRGRGIDGARLLQAVSTPGLWDAAAHRFPGFDAAFSVSPPKDEAFADIAVDVVERERPNLLLLHLSSVDHWHHEKGPWSPEAVAAIETADAQVARVMEAARHAGIWEHTLLLVVSDHGFARQEKILRPSVLLREDGLIALDAQNRVASWRAQALTFGGGAYIYLRDPNDADAAGRVRGIFSALAEQPGSGIARVLSRGEIGALGGDPQAFLALEAAGGFGFAGGVTGDAVASAPTPGIHGFPPDRPVMNSSLLIVGPGVRRGPMEGARLVDIAPTVARWLGFSMKEVEGRPLDIVETSAKDVRRQ